MVQMDEYSEEEFEDLEIGFGNTISNKSAKLSHNFDNDVENDDDDSVVVIDDAEEEDLVTGIGNESDNNDDNDNDDHAVTKEKDKEAVVLTKPRKVKSVWWDYFNTVLGKEDVALCSLCNKEVKRSRSSTGHLKSHMQIHHKFEYDKALQKGSAPKMQQTLHKSLEIARQAHFENCLMMWIVQQCMPFSVVDNKYFESLIKSINTTINVPSRHTFRKRLSEVAGDKRNFIKKFFSTENVAITLDKWTSKSCQSYLGVTAHFITNDWKIQSITLQCKREECNTAEEFENTFKGIMEEYSLQRRVVAVVSDTEPTMSLFGKNIFKNEGIPWIGCVAHIFQLSTNKTGPSSSLGHTLSCCRRLVGHFRKSPQRMAVLEKVCKLSGITFVRPIEDVSTRWWSTYRMIDRLIHLKPMIVIMASRVDQKTLRELNLTEAQWSQVNDLSEILKPFWRAQQSLEGEKYVTLSLVPNQVKYIRNVLKSYAQPKEQVQSAIVELAGELLNHFNGEWGSGEDGTVVNEHKTLGVRQRAKGLQPLHFVALCLDPRTKDLKAIPNVEHEDVWTLAKDLMKSNYINHFHETTTQVIQKKAKKIVNEACEIDEYEAMFGGNEDEEDSVEVTEESLDARVQKMLDDEVINYRSKKSITKDNNPLEWWKKHAFEFPVLSFAAKCFFAVPATSAPVERLFSSAGLVVTSLRNRLHPDIVDATLFLKESWETIDTLQKDEKLLRNKRALDTTE